MLPLSQTYATWLAVLRIYTGVFWLFHGVPKLLNPRFATPGGMMSGMIQQNVAQSSGPYHDFLVTVVLPHAALFAHLVAWGETLTGVSLLLGLLSRVGGLVGVFLPLNYWLMKSGYSEWSTLGGLDWAAMALSFTHLVLPTSLVLGVDALIARRPRRRRG